MLNGIHLKSTNTMVINYVAFDVLTFQSENENIVKLFYDQRV